MYRLFRSEGIAWSQATPREREYYIKAVGGQEYLATHGWGKDNSLYKWEDWYIESVRLAPIELTEEMVRDLEWPEYYDFISVKEGKAIFFSPFAAHQDITIGIKGNFKDAVIHRNEEKKEPDLYTGHELFGEVLISEGGAKFFINHVLEEGTLFMKIEDYPTEILYRDGWRIANDKDKPTWEDSRSLDKNER